MTTDRIPPPRPATLADVAKVAGVAVSTVSRALSNPGRVHPQTRERIEQAARELRYVANSSARALSSGRTGTVAVLVSDITNPFYFDIIRGTQQHLKAAGYSQLLVDTDESAELEGSMVTRLQQTCDGAILTAPRLTDAQLQRLTEVTPLVTINRPRAGLGSVIIDTASGVEQAMQHLASLNHRTVVYASGPKSSWSNERRWRAVLRAGAKLGIEVTRTGPFPPKQTSGSAAADAVLNTGATACIAFNDLLAIGMLARFRERGVAVPADLSIVGCDDIFGADFCDPPLTTLTAPIEQASRLAVTMLLARITATDPSQLATAATLPTHLTVRRSTGPAPRHQRRTS
jgi:DNA-binding LacI/PurR family transcriptional regulator